jgi:hypothetical protein
MAKKDRVEEVQSLWKTYSSKRETWANHAREDQEFRYGKQWSDEQRKKLEARGQAAVVVNRIHPAVESAKAMLTSNKPSFRVSPREDSDNQIAQTINGLLEYMWHISDGDQVLRNVIDDYYVTGMGCMLVYQDPMKDMGKGEVCLLDIDPLTVYVDPNSRNRSCSDAENIIISRLFTKAQAKKLYPMYEKAIKNATSDSFNTDIPVTTRAGDGEVIFPEDTETQTQTTFGDGDDYIRGYERYHKTITQMHRVFESWSGHEHLLDDNAFKEYIQRPAWIIEGNIIAKPEMAVQLIQQLSMQYEQIAQQAKMMGQKVPPPPQVEQVTHLDLLKQQQIKSVTVPTKRIKMEVIMGDTLLYERILPTERYPLVFYMNMHTRTPYPVSDVRMVKGVQEYINKTRSLIIAHATTSTNLKVLLPSGSVDMNEFEEKWAQPGVGIEVDFDLGIPQVAQPVPLPNELYQNETTAKSDIDHQLGLYEMMMGNSQAAPHTYKATVSLDEFGQRKMKSKLADIEYGLKHTALVAIDMMQQLYKEEKIIRLLKPNNSMSEYVINKRLYDDKGNTKILNDIGVGKYDVVVVTGSTLPTNRYAQLELYMDAYKNGIIDKQEVLKKTEVFDMEGVMQRTDMIAQLQQQVQQAGEQIKKLQGDLQTREREVYHAKQRAEVEKFKGNLDSTSTKAKAAGTIFEKRLDDAMGQIQKEVRDASKPSSTPSSPNKGS